MGIMTKVLVPVSVQEEGELICEFLAGMGSVGTREVVLTNVLDPTGLEAPIVASMADNARDRFTELVEPTKSSGIHVQVRVATGQPGEEIAHLALNEGYTGLVVGTRGKSEWAKVFTGSVSGDLLSSVRLPMMFVRFDLMRNVDDPALLAKTFPQTIIAAVDFSAGSMLSILALLEMGLPKVGTVFLVHVLSADLEGEELKDAEAGAVFQLKNEAALLKREGINARVVVRQGDPTRELLDEIDDRRATGVIMGARGRSVLKAAVLGSKSGAIVEQAPCPVIIIP